MRVGFSKVKRYFLVFAVAILTTLPVLAEENIISSVIISKAKDGLNKYELNIDSTQSVQYKSRIDSDGNVYFDLKNSVVAQNLGTIYDDVSDIDNVTVKQLDKSKVRIYVSGKDVKYTDLIFVNSVLDTEKEQNKKIVINRPIKEYKSTSYHDDLEVEEDVQEWDDNSFNFTHLTTSILSELKNGISGKILLILSVLVMISIFIKSLATKLSQEKEPLIGLNSQRYLNNSMPNIPVKEENTSQTISREEALKKAQIQLSKAHQKYQQYIQNKYKTIQKPASINNDNLKKSIALNQYQRSTQNPYKNQDVIRINKEYSTNVLKNSENDRIARTQQNKPREFNAPYIQRTNNFINTDNRQSDNKYQTKTNMKFLESVTKIYERSGRGDLADGLKNSINKAKQTI